MTSPSSWGCIRGRCGGPSQRGRAARRGVAAGAGACWIRTGRVVDQLLAEGVWNAVVIWRELQAKGYAGGISILRDYLRPKRGLRPEPGDGPLRDGARAAAPE